MKHLPKGIDRNHFFVHIIFDVNVQNVRKNNNKKIQRNSELKEKDFFTFVKYIKTSLKTEFLLKKKRRGEKTIFSLSLSLSKIQQKKTKKQTNKQKKNQRARI